MARHRFGTAAFIVLLSCAAYAQAPQGNAAAQQEPATPTTIIEHPQTRIVRVDILASSTRSMHSHDDMLWHVFVTMDAPIVLNIQGGKEPIRLEPWKSHFFKGGTVHSITNPNPKPVQFLEFFAKKQ